MKTKTMKQYAVRIGNADKIRGCNFVTEEWGAIKLFVTKKQASQFARVLQKHTGKKMASVPVWIKS